MDTKIRLRRCRPEEWAALLELSRQTFYTAFAAQNTPENMQAYLEKAFRPERMQAELAHPDSQFWLAGDGDQLAGYMKINGGGAQTEPQPEPALEIERIYVQQAWQGRGVGRLLFEKALDLARSAGVAYLWLGVWEHNLKAIRFYEKNGLHIFGQHTFYMGAEAQTDLLLKMNVTDSHTAFVG